MKTWVMVFVLLGAAHSVLAQETHSVLAQEIAGVKEAKTATVATSIVATAVADSTPVLVAAADLSNAAVWNHGVNLREIAASRAADAEPGFAPAAAPQREGVTEDLSPLRWQVAFGPSFVRFRSSIFDASMAGTVTSVSWAKNDWLAVEGQVVTGFAPTIYDREHVKYVNYGAGVKIGTRRAKWEPYGHLLIGGAHIQPQTSGNTRNAFMIEAGGGADYRFWSRMSFRGQVDYLRTSFFKSTQNNLQISIAAVFHF
jgi:hypothetical protein